MPLRPPAGAAPLCGASPTLLASAGRLSALEDIWRCALCGGGGEVGLGLRTADLASACVVLALPDMFDRRFGSDLLSLLLAPSGLGFKAAILHEEVSTHRLAALPRRPVSPHRLAAPNGTP